MDSNNFTWNGLNRKSNLTNVVNVIYDQGVTGFRGVEAGDFLGQTTICSNSSISGVNGDVLIANSGRKSIFVQNLNTGVLYVRLGTGAANANFNVILKSCAAIDDGNGGAVSDNQWKGIVSVSGINPRYISWETQ